jgi:two-component system sensor histidine kinase KdpD
MTNEAYEKIIFLIGEILIREDRSFRENLQEVISLLTGYYEVSRCSIMTVNMEEQALEVSASTKAEIIGQKRKLSDVTIATRALLDGTPLTTNPKRLSFFKPLESTNFSSSYSINIPVIYLDKKLGVITLSDPQNGEPLSEEQELFAVRTARHIAPYIYAVITGEQLESKVVRYEKKMKELMELDELKTDLTNFIVHDLKGPISTIMANLDMLSYEELTPLQFEYLNLAAGDTYKLQRMVMNMLDVSKLEHGKVMIYREDIDIKELVARELASCKVSMKQKGIEQFLEGEGRIIFIDENLIARVISNLLLNALDYSSEGGVITVGITYDEKQKQTVIAIADHGSGVPDDLKAKIFDKYFQVKSEERQRKMSTGLGLTFCDLVVKAHGGVLWVEDTAGGGATFKFTLPETVMHEESNG